MTIIITLCIGGPVVKGLYCYCSAVSQHPVPLIQIYFYIIAVDTDNIVSNYFTKKYIYVISYFSASEPNFISMQEEKTQLTLADAGVRRRTRK